MITIILAGRVSLLLMTLRTGGRRCHWKHVGVSISLSNDNGHRALLPGGTCWLPCLKTGIRTSLICKPLFFYRLLPVLPPRPPPHPANCGFPVVCMKRSLNSWCTCLAKEGKAKPHSKQVFRLAGPIQVHCSSFLKAFTCDSDLPNLAVRDCSSKW